MSYKYQLTKTAVRDMDMTLLYIINELCNPSAARTYLSKIESVIESICLFPDYGVLVSSSFIPNWGIRKAITGKYILYYYATSDTIIILRVVSETVNQDNILNSLIK